MRTKTGPNKPKSDGKRGEQLSSARRERNVRNWHSSRSAIPTGPAGSQRRECPPVAETLLLLLIFNVLLCSCITYTQPESSFQSITCPPSSRLHLPAPGLCGAEQGQGRSAQLCILVFIFFCISASLRLHFYSWF